MAMQQQKESMLKKSITVGEVLSLAIALLGAGILFYTTVQVRLSALELRMSTSEKSIEVFRVNQVQFQDRIETKLDAIKDDISTIKIENSKNRK